MPACDWCAMRLADRQIWHDGHFVGWWCGSCTGPKDDER